LGELPVRSYVAEPERGRRKWTGREAEQRAVYANRRRIQGQRGKRLQSQRGDKVERNFAHQFDTGGLDRLYLRGRSNVHKRLLLQAAACNLALLMRSLFGAGKPRAAADRAKEAALLLLRLITVSNVGQNGRRLAATVSLLRNDESTHLSLSACRPRKSGV
jgi:hypothetical protein